MNRLGRVTTWICLLVLVVAAARMALGDEPRLTLRTPGWVGGVAFTADGTRLATGSSDGTARLWDTSNGSEVARYDGHRDCVASVAVARDGRTLATGSYDHEVRLWDVSSERTIHRLIGHRGAVISVAFHPDGKSIATGSIDGTVRLWNVVTGRPKDTLEGHQSWVNSVVFAADGRTLASASSDATVRVWNVSPSGLRSSFGLTKAEVRSIALSPDSRLLAAGVRYGDVQVWDMAAEAVRWRLVGHKSDVWSVVFAPDGKTLATGNGDWNEPGEIKFWDAASGRHLRTLRHSGEVLCVAFSQDGKSLAAGSADKTVCIWDVGVSGQAKASDDTKWIEPMRRVRARFKGTPGTFAQFGDSITVSLAYWAPLAGEPKKLSSASAAALERVKKHMKPECWREWRGGKFGSDGGMTIRWAHENIDKWLKEHNPEAALVMFGTNDIGQVPLDENERKLAEVVERCLVNGTVAIVSTIPPRRGHLDESRKFAEAARKVAREKRVPLVDYQAEILRRRPDDWDGSLAKFKGKFEDVYDAPTLVSGDGVHPSNPKSHQDYSDESLRTNGYVLRNYLTLLTYARVIDEVLERKKADQRSGPK